MTALETGLHYPLRLEQLPASWEVGYVGDFAEKIEPGFASGKHNKSGEGIPHLRPFNVDRQGKLDLSDIKSVAPEANSKRLQDGDVLFNNTNSPELIGKTAVVTRAEDWGFSNHMTRIHFRSDVIPKFAAYQLHYLWMTGYFLHNCVKHVNQASVSSKKFSSAVPFIAPPTEQQRIIVEEIEKQFSRLDEAVTNLHRVKTNLKRYKAAALSSATSGCTAGTTKEDWAGVVPEEWPWIRVEDLASDQPRSIQSGPFGSNLRHSEFQAVGRLVIGIDNVQDGRFVLGAEHRISHEKYQQLIKYAARPRDVLITVMATIGRVCVIPPDIEPAIITKHVYRITANQSLVVPEYLALALRGSPQVRSQILTSAQGQTRPGLNGALVKQIRIPIPPLEAQSQILEHVERVESIAREIGSQVESGIKRSERLRPAILARCFSGKRAMNQMTLLDPSNGVAAR